MVSWDIVIQATCCMQCSRLVRRRWRIERLHLNPFCSIWHNTPVYLSLITMTVIICHQTSVQFTLLPHRHQNSPISACHSVAAKPVSIQFKLINCKNSTKDAPKLAFLSSKIEKFLGRGHSPLLRPLPTPYPPQRPRRLHPRAYGARPQPQGRLSRVLWVPSDAPVTEIDP